MFNTTIRVLFVSSALIGLNACSPSGSDTSAPPPNETASSPVDVEKQASGPAYTSPGVLSSCTEGQVVNLKWDFRATHPTLSEVEILTGSPPNETLFAVGGPAGEAPTGAWARPGTTFLIKNKQDGQELTRVTVAGPRCSG